MGWESALTYLINYSLGKKYIHPSEKYYAINGILKMLNYQEYESKVFAYKNKNDALDILLLHINKNNPSINTEIVKSEILDSLIGSPFYIQSFFNSIPYEDALEWFSSLCNFTGYIDKEKVKKNIRYDWEDTLKISINTLKPEITNTSPVKRFRKYPESLISEQNVGYTGGRNYPLRKFHRIIPIKLNNENWCLQLSPYSYLENHGILFTKKVTPMSSDRNTINAMLDFIDLMNFCSVMSNSDKKGTGASILGHKHLQFSTEILPIEKAKTSRMFTKNNVKFERVSWKVGTWVLSSKFKIELLNESANVIEKWKKIEYESQYFKNDGNTAVSLIAKKVNSRYYIYIIFRTNMTSRVKPGKQEYGIPRNLWAIKKEGIGVVEASGFAILPGRIISEIKKPNFSEDWAEWWKWIKNKFPNHSSSNWKQLVGFSFNKILISINCFSKDPLVEKALILAIK